MNGGWVGVCWVSWVWVWVRWFHPKHHFTPKWMQWSQTHDMATQIHTNSMGIIKINIYVKWWLLRKLISSELCTRCWANVSRWLLQWTQWKRTFNSSELIVKSRGEYCRSTFIQSFFLSLSLCHSLARLFHLSPILCHSVYLSLLN